MNIKAIISEMTLEEKLAQMSQFNANCLDTTASGEVTGPASELNLTASEVKATGSVLNFTGALEMIRIQEKFLENYSIPLLFMQDVIHGYRTIYPIPLGMAASFDTDLVKRCSTMAAKEASASGVHVTFTPMVDIVRDARWGRCMESAGEDTYLGCVMARAQVEGFQGDFKKPYNIPACVKHFAAYGAAVAGRDYNAVEIGEQPLFEYYMPPYKAAVDAGVEMVMTSFNTTNGIPSSANKWLVDEILRKEWGFDKLIISDYNAIGEMQMHGYSSGEKQSAMEALSAGTDIEMMSSTFLKSIPALIDEGKITMEQVDRAVERILRLKEKLGLFKNPYKNADAKKAERLYLSKPHKALCKEAAEKAAVLLKNDGVLPLNKDKKPSLLIAGPYADMGMIGFWSCCGREDEAKGVYTVFRKALGARKVAFAKGADGALNAEPDKAMILEAKRRARNKDAVILCLGEASGMSGEGNSRANIEPSEAQLELLKAVKSVNDKVIVVIYSGRPLALTKVEKYASAIIEMWQPGTMGAEALSSLVFGEANFEGRLPQSFPRHVGQCPIYYNRMNTGRPKLDDGDFTKMYISQYLDVENTPLYPFGYGLSYTSFSVSPITLSKSALCENEGDFITASVTVKNTGKVRGVANIQLYIRDLVASVVRPVKELKAFKKLSLMPGEEKTVDFKIEKDMLAFYNRELKRVCEKGDFMLFIGQDSDTANSAKFSLV